MENSFDIIVVGSGPGGYVTAIRASQLGFKVAVVEKESLGGICLNWGCIPTKALLKSAQVYNNIKKAKDYGLEVKDVSFNFKAIIERSRGVANKMSKGIEFLMNKNKITVLKGTGKLEANDKVSVVDSKGDKKTYSAKHIILATGGRAKELPNLKIDDKYIIGYRKALSLAALPEKMLIVGAGAIGVEFAYFYNTLGVDVTVVEYMKQGLLPREDQEVSRTLNRIFKKQGIDVKSSTAVEKVDIVDGKCHVQIKDLKKDKTETLEADVVLSAVGVTPNTENIGLEELGVKVSNGYVDVDDYYRTNIETSQRKIQRDKNR